MEFESEERQIQLALDVYKKGRSIPLQSVSLVLMLTDSRQPTGMLAKN